MESNCDPSFFLPAAQSLYRLSYSALRTAKHTVALNALRIKPIRADSSAYIETLSTDLPPPHTHNSWGHGFRSHPPRYKQDSWITLKSIERGNCADIEGVGGGRGEWQLVLNPAWNFCIPPLGRAFRTARRYRTSVYCTCLSHWTQGKPTGMPSNSQLGLLSLLLCMQLHIKQ